MANSRAPETGATYDVVIVGAGFAGMYMLHCLRKLGLRALTDSQIAKCLLTPGATKDPAVQNELSDAHVKGLNLGADWLNHLLPCPKAVK